jgi:hypothetical protein
VSIGRKVWQKTCCCYDASTRQKGGKPLKYKDFLWNVKPYETPLKGKRSRGYLGMLDIDATTEVLFIADGADWIWKRVHLVAKVIQDKGGRFRCLLDYYRMKSYLHAMAGAA